MAIGQLVGLVVGALVCGVWFLERPHSRALAPVLIYVAVSVVWAALGLQAYLRHDDAGRQAGPRRGLRQVDLWMKIF